MSVAWGGRSRAMAAGSCPGAQELCGLPSSAPGRSRFARRASVSRSPGRADEKRRFAWKGALCELASASRASGSDGTRGAGAMWPIGYLLLDREAAVHALLEVPGKVADHHVAAGGELEASALRLAGSDLLDLSGRLDALGLQALLVDLVALHG